MELIFFPTSDDFRKWLNENHQTETVLWVGYYKKVTGIPSITWPESVDQALCFGWIDGLRKSINENAYKIRFTPRKPRSIWSKVNIERMKELTKLGLVQPAGLEAFKKKKEKNSIRYSYEQGTLNLDPIYEKLIKENKDAWTFYQKLPPSVKKPCIWWVMGAKREETRLRRLNILIESSASGKKIPPLRRSPEK